MLMQLKIVNIWFTHFRFSPQDVAEILESEEAVKELSNSDIQHIFQILVGRDNKDETQKGNMIMYFMVFYGGNLFNP